MSNRDEEIRAEVHDLQVKAHALATEVGRLLIETAADYELAGEDLKRLKTAQKELEARRVAITGPLNEALRSANALFRAPADWLESAERALKTVMLDFRRKEDARRAEEQRRLDEEARKERERLQREAREQEEKAARARSEKGQERAEAKAEELHAQAAQVVAPRLDMTPPKVAGQAVRERWTFRIADPMLVPREYLVVDEQKIGGVVRALKGLTKIPGVEVLREEVLSSRGA